MPMVNVSPEQADVTASQTVMMAVTKEIVRVLHLTSIEKH